MSDTNAAAMAIQSGLAVQRVENETLVQISIARPRDEEAAERKILASIERYPDFADEALYEFQRGGNTIRGLSVVAAREIARIWGNNATRTSFIDAGDGQIVACGIFVDMETGRRSEKQVLVPRIVKRKRESYRLSDDEYNMQARIEASKMERNAILDCLPMPMKSEIYSKCVAVVDKVVEKTGQAPNERWSVFVASLARINVTAEQALSYLKLTSENELTHASLNQLKRTMNAIAAGETSAAVVFGVEPVVTGAKTEAPSERAAKAGATVREKSTAKPTDDGGSVLIAASRASIERIVEGPDRERAMTDCFGSTSWADVETFSLADLRTATEGSRVEKIVDGVLGDPGGYMFAKGAQ